MFEETPIVNNAAVLEAENSQKSGQNGPSPDGSLSPAIKDFRDKFRRGRLFDVMESLGEDGVEYGELAESLLRDLQPTPGLETQLVEQMSQALWRMKRAQRMQDGLALRRLSQRKDMDEYAKVEKASIFLKALEPFERLQVVLSRRTEYPTRAEIDEFIDSREGHAETCGDFIALLKLLPGLTDPAERKAALRRSRARLREVIKPYESTAWRMSGTVQQASSAENLAALMAPDCKASAQAQRMEDSSFRRLCRITQLFAKIRKGALQKTIFLQNEGQGMHVIENTGEGSTVQA